MMTKTVFILAGALTALPAMAETITFTISATGSGTLAGTSFSDQTITFTEVTDTTDIAACPSETYPCAPDQADNTVTIGGVAYSITSDTYFFDNGINLVGIGYEAGQTYLSAEDGAVFNTYGLTTALSSASYGLYDIGLSSDLSTSGGTLSISGYGDGAMATFSAVLGAPVGTAVPEPRSLGLVLVAAIALAASLSRRRKLRLTERAN